MDTIFFQKMVRKEEADYILLGIPFDGTVTGRPGSRYGPDAIRKATLDSEDYSPYFDNDISDIKLFDYGNLEIPFGDTNAALSRIKEKCIRINKLTGRLIALGGEHLITLPIVEALCERYGRELFLIQFDAHADMRQEYLGVKHSHATVMNLTAGLIGIENMAMIGIRSGMKEEWKLLRSHPHYFGGISSRTIEDFRKFVEEKLHERKVYVTIDFDVFDPGIFPGTGTPEPGGINFTEFIEYMKILSGVNIIGADLVELVPDADISGISRSLAATVLRELIFTMERKDVYSA